MFQIWFVKPPIYYWIKLSCFGTVTHLYTALRVRNLFGNQHTIRNRMSARQTSFVLDNLSNEFISFANCNASLTDLPLKVSFLLSTASAWGPQSYRLGLRKTRPKVKRWVGKPKLLTCDTCRTQSNLYVKVPINLAEEKSGASLLVVYLNWYIFPIGWSIKHFPSIGKHPLPTLSSIMGGLFSAHLKYQSVAFFWTHFSSFPLEPVTVTLPSHSSKRLTSILVASRP